MGRDGIPADAAVERSPGGVLALWSFGMVMAESCGLSYVSSGLGLLLGVKENSVRQRLREWYYGKEDKRGRGDVRSR